jgi:SAM-dependent methyltransferase
VSRDEQTIDDFGEQWSHYSGNEGYYASLDLLRDMLGPLVSFEELAGARVADIGSGTGRIVRMLLEAGAGHVLAVEPSVGVEKLRANTAAYGSRVRVLHARGDALPAGLDLDFVVSIGVIQFIRDPLPTLRAARAALRPGGSLVIWVYGRDEGNAVYPAVVGGLRVLTTRLPHRALALLCHGLRFVVTAYSGLCRALPAAWPLRDYLLHTFSKLSPREQVLTIYDQLNPRYARYYRREEVVALLEEAGFVDIGLHHRRGYSWTARATKPL